MEAPLVKEITHRFAGVFLITEDGRVVGQLRDNKPNIDNPGTVSAFGGAVNSGEEPVEAAWRELIQEETNLKIDITNIKPLMSDVAWRKFTKEWEVRHFFYANISDYELNNLKVYEGQGWAYISGPDDPNIIDSWKPVIEKLFNELHLSKHS